MLAAILHEFGDPKNLTVQEVPPRPSADEALVEVHAAGINPSDVKNVAGAMHGTTLPRIPGRDFAGIVTAGPPGFLGREVWGTGGDIGFTRDGSHAQYIRLPLAAVSPKPKNLSMEDAGGAAALIFVTAWSALVKAANLSSGETAVIVGAAGGVGSAAVQIAKSRGARVIAVVRSDADLAVATQLGADHAINSRNAKLPDSVRALTSGRGAEVVFDASGMMFPDSVEAAALDARIPIIAAPHDGQSTFNLRSLYRKTLRIFGVDTRHLDAVASAKLLAEMNPLFESGQFHIKPPIRRPLTEIVQAYEDAARGQTRIVLQPNPS